MLEARVPMDIRAYRAKQLGPFTGRQIICGGIAGILDFLLFTQVFDGKQTSMQTAIFFLSLLDALLLLFTLEILGMPMERYLVDVVLVSFLSPTRRMPAGTQRLGTGRTYRKKERRLAKRTMKKRKKTDPSLVLYR